MQKKRLLVIDDEPDVCALVADVAEGIGFEALVAATADAFRSHVRDFDPNVIVLDLNMPQADGIELLRFLGKAKVAAKILLISGSSGRVLTTASRLGKSHGLDILGTLTKPIDLNDLEKILNTIEMTAGGEAPTERELRVAIEGGQLIVFYQPKIDLQIGQNGELVACEGLVRWNHPSRGVISPDFFIPLAERTGLISPLTDRVIGTVLDQLGIWDKEGLSLSVAVNIAAQMLDDLKFPDRLFDLMKGRDLHPSRLVLEITETGAMSNEAHVMDILARFRLKEFGLSLDDFGTGYSSLVQLHRMPFNEMKIDLSFVTIMDRDSEAGAIVRTIVNLGKSLGIRLCAEGVETLPSLQQLRSIGCDMAQGYYIGHPMPADEIRLWRTKRWDPGLPGPTGNSAGEQSQNRGKKD